MKFSLKKDTCQYICIILIILILSIFIRVIFNDQFEHMISFTLKFKAPDTPGVEPPFANTLDKFDFEIIDLSQTLSSGTIIKKDSGGIDEVSFNITQPSDIFMLKIIPKKGDPQIKEFKFLGVISSPIADRADGRYSYHIQISPQMLAQHQDGLSFEVT